MAVNRYHAIAVLLIVSFLLVAGASAAKEKVKDPKKIASHAYNHVEVNGIVETILGLLGIEQKESYYEVEVNGAVVAEIPEDSVLLGITVHDACLPYQYGTDKWYKCEVALQ